MAAGRSSLLQRYAWGASQAAQHCAGFDGAPGEAETRDPWIARLDRESPASSAGGASRHRKESAPTCALRVVRGLAADSSTPPTNLACGGRSKAKFRGRGCWLCGLARAWPRTRQWPRRRWRPVASAGAPGHGRRGTAGRGNRPPAVSGMRSAGTRLLRQVPPVFCDNWRPVDPDTPGTTWPAPRSSCGRLVFGTVFGNRSANRRGACRARGHRKGACRATGRACDRVSLWSPVQVGIADAVLRRCLDRRHARAGRSPRASEVGAQRRTGRLTGQARMTRLGAPDGAGGGGDPKGVSAWIFAQEADWIRCRSVRDVPRHVTATAGRCGIGFFGAMKGRLLGFKTNFSSERIGGTGQAVVFPVHTVRLHRPEGGSARDRYRMAETAPAGSGRRSRLGPGRRGALL